ncbi:MAG: hypothetical protein Q7V58_11375 [Actinomycetota bacterium]|nr:hypothetical protein [Actinomycetota bacterium]MDP1877506.1 hypothetical protein [Actinomycetota bacterium]
MTVTDPPPAAPHPTYGELMDRARWHTVHAHALLTQARFASQDHARDAVRSRAELLAGLAAHARAVIGPAHLTALREHPVTRRTPDAVDSRVRHLLTWIDALTEPSWRSLSTPDDIDEVRDTGDRGPVCAAYRAATLAVKAATDLILTHYRGTGAARAWTPPALTATGYGPLVVEVARVAAIAAAIEPLAVRCRQAGLTRSEVDLDLPLADRLVDDTWSLAAEWGFPQPGIRDITVARPAIRTGDPAAEWTDRIHHVRDRMRAHQDTGHAGVRTLQDVARLGTVISHILATSGTDAPVEQAAITARWRSITEYLAPLRSTEPADRTVRSHVERMLELARPAHTQDAPRARDRLLRAIADTAPVLDECAAIADRLAASSTDLWIPAKPTRPYLRSIRTAGLAARRPTEAPRAWPRPTRATGAGTARWVGLT